MVATVRVENVASIKILNNLKMNFKNAAMLYNNLRHIYVLPRETFLANELYYKSKYLL